MSEQAQDLRFMQAALAFGRRGLGTTWPNPSVACLIVRDDGTGPILVGRGVTAAGGRPHGEVVALGQAGERARGATAYVTLEPCSHHGRTPPCTEALARAGVARVVAAIRDPDSRVAGTGFTQLASFGIAVATGLCEPEARCTHLGHFVRVAAGRPAVTLKMAVSADGLVAGPGGRPVRITGPEATARVHRMRAAADAILVGIGTVLADDPLLTVRLPGLERRQPVRIVLDSFLRLPPLSRLATTARAAPLWVVCSSDASEDRAAVIEAAGAIILRMPQAGRLDLGAALRLLGARGLTRCLVEAGPTLAAALVHDDLIEDAVLFTAPDRLGEGIAAFAPATAAHLAAALPHRHSWQVGRDRMTVQRRG